VFKPPPTVNMISDLSGFPIRWPYIWHVEW